MKTLSKTDLLLLDYASEYFVPIHVYLEDSKSKLNKADHGLSKKDLFERLSYLSKINLISFYDSNVEFEIGKLIVQFHHEDFWLGLTKKGQLVWEKYFEPNWSLYCDFSAGFDRGCDQYQEMTLVASRKNLVRSYLELLPHSTKLLEQIVLKKKMSVVHYKKLVPCFEFSGTFGSDSFDVIDQISIEMGRVKWKLNWEEIKNT
ncbi:hypothetical protein [Aquirhabdus sp.]|uniref:hypothetical protein n=1 Tax=Aquirhabdus sp. TaxID=2824160 RepID=UPI00396CFE8F